MKRKSDANLDFGRRLKEIRTLKKLSVEQVASALPVAKSTYRDWENGRAVSGQPYIQLAKVLEVSVYELLGVYEPSKEKLTNELQQVEDMIKRIKSEL